MQIIYSAAVITMICPGSGKRLPLTQEEECNNAERSLGGGCEELMNVLV